MSSVIIQPVVANVMNAVMCGLMSFGLLMTPQKFMQGGQYQNPWFNNIPEERDNKVFYLGQFMAFLMLGGCVVPTLLSPTSQFLCFQMALVHVVNMIHSIIFLTTNEYKDAKPTTLTGRVQWYFMTFLSLVFFIVTLLASLHSTDNIVDNKETYISKTIANIVMMAFSSIFGVLFVSIPKLLLSMYWTEENLEETKTCLGFNILNMSDLEKWWARCIGTVILALNLGVAVDLNIEQPLYTAGSLVIVSTLTLFNLHQVVMRPYKSISTRQVLFSWLPNLVMSGTVIGVLTIALLYT